VGLASRPGLERAHAGAPSVRQPHATATTTHADPVPCAEEPVGEELAVRRIRPHAAHLHARALGAAVFAKVCAARTGWRQIEGDRGSWLCPGTTALHRRVVGIYSI
jgi:hypothetical protein